MITLIAVLAGLYPVGAALRATGRNSPAVTPSSVAPAAESAPATLEFPTAKDLVSAYFYSREANPAATVKVSEGSYHIEFLIATLPDPIRSPLPHSFDSFVESLESAAEAAGYTLDRFALPWPQTASGEQPPRWQLGLYETHPGMILFRDPTHLQLLLIFLVGETPTTGIHKQAMSSALDQIAQFYNWDAKTSTPPAASPSPAVTADATPGAGGTIRIMGPAFSGSAVSLRFVLDRWGQSHAGVPNLKFQIISGTATAIDAAWLEQAAQGRTTFQATVPPDNETLHSIACYIGSLGYTKFAVLTEGNTAYGQNFAKQSTPGETAANRDSQNCGNGQPPPEILSLPFPMHISRLRAAANSAAQQKKSAANSAASGGAASSPRESTGDDEPREVLPSYSDLSIQSAELTLANLLAAISREEFSYVGIVATDVRDVTFLARQVREHCPATVLFTLNSDLLYAVPGVNSATRGLVVITPYPLFNLEQLWTYAYGGGKSRLQFANQAAEGVYNATLALLQADAKMVDYGRPLARAATTPSPDPRRPSLWVTAIGNEETVPIRLLGWKDVNHYTFSPSDRAQAPKLAIKPTVGRGIYAENTVVAVIVLSLVLCAFSALMIGQYWRPGKSGAAPIFAVLGDTAAPAYWSECRLFLLCACTSLLAAYILVVAAFCLPFATGQELSTGIQTTPTAKVAVVLAVVTTGLLFTATHKLLAAFRRAPAEQRGSAPEVVFFALSSTALVFVLVVLLAGAWLQQVRAYPASGLFNHLRSFDLRGGLSALLPLCFVGTAACLWALCSFRRLRVLDVLRATGTPDKPHAWLNFVSLDVRSFNGVRDLESSVKHILESSSVISLRWYCVLMALGLAVGHYFFSTRLVRAFEPRPYYWLFETAFIIVYWALLTEFLRLIFAWRSLHLLLQRLSWHPLLGAFKRYRENRLNLAKMNLTHPPSSFAALEASVGQAGRVVRAADALARSENVAAALREAIRQSLAEWDAQLQTADARFCEALRLQWAAEDSPAAARSAGETARKTRASHIQGNWRQSLVSRAHAHQALFRFAQSLAKTLEGYWSACRAADCPPADDAAVKQFLEQGEEFIVSRVVNFLAIVFPSLQNLGYFVLGGLLLMLLAVTSYPFQPREEFLFFNWVVILSFVGTVFWIFVQMDRDTVLSLLNDSTPGQINFSRELALRTFLYVALPLLALLGAQFPESLRQILSLFTATQGGS